MYIHVLESIVLESFVLEISVLESFLLESSVLEISLLENFVLERFVLESFVLERSVQEIFVLESRTRKFHRKQTQLLLYFIPPDGPTFLVQPRTVSGNEMDTVTLKCSVDSNPKALYHWTRGEEREVRCVHTVRDQVAIVAVTLMLLLLLLLLLICDLDVTTFIVVHVLHPLWI